MERWEALRSWLASTLLITACLLFYNFNPWYAKTLQHNAQLALISIAKTYPAILLLLTRFIGFKRYEKLPG